MITTTFPFFKCYFLLNIDCLPGKINFLDFNYFVSSSDLHDILSNANELEKVINYLTKLFNSLSKVRQC